MLSFVFESITWTYSYITYSRTFKKTCVTREKSGAWQTHFRFFTRLTLAPRPDDDATAKILASHWSDCHRSYYSMSVLLQLACNNVGTIREKHNWVTAKESLTLRLFVNHPRNFTKFSDGVFCTRFSGVPAVFILISYNNNVKGAHEVTTFHSRYRISYITS